MAIVNLQYCNQSLGPAEVNVSYDDVLHEITDGGLTGPCGPSGQQEDFLLYTQVVGNTVYEVFTQNTAPYAYVSARIVPSCSVVIDSIIVGDASNESSADGSILVNASGFYAKQYSRNNGLTYQVSNQFLNVPRGTYLIRVRSQHPDGSFCFDTEEVVVGFNAIANCQLELGNITFTNPTSIGGVDGSLKVNTLFDPIGLAVEYRIDAGAWQDSPEFDGLNAGVKNVQVRYKDYPDCSDNRDIELIDEGVECDVFIENVVITHEQTKFGDNGQLEIIATSGAGGLQYSINDGADYQASNLFQDKPPGTYQVRVKDAADCEDARTVIIHPFKAPHIDFPIAQAHRFVISSLGLQNFDNTLFKNMRFPGVEPCVYRSLIQLAENTSIQFRSNYSEHTLKVMNEADDSEAGTIEIEMKKAFTRQTIQENGFLASAGGNETQLFFENGLPDWAKVGQDVAISGTAHGTLNDTFEIKDIRPGVLGADGFVAVILDVIYPAVGTIGAVVDVEYDIEPFDVFEAVINWIDFAAGHYYLKVEGTDDQFDDFTALSEPIDLAAAHSDTVVMGVKNIDNAFKIFYDTGIEHLIRIEGELKWPLPGGTEVNHEDSNNTVIKLYENVTRTLQLFIYAIPPYLAEKIAVLLAHDYLTINDVRYVKADEKIEIEHFDMEPLCNLRVKLRQAEFIAENTDDDGDVDVPVDVLQVNGTLLKMNP